MHTQNQAAAKEIEALRQSIGDAHASGDVAGASGSLLIRGVGAMMMLVK